MMDSNKSKLEGLKINPAGLKGIQNEIKNIKRTWPFIH